MNKKKLLIITIIIVLVIVILFIGIEINYRNIIGMECCLCEDVNIESTLITNCNGNVTNCIGCCECKYDLIKRITTIYDYYTN